MAVVAAIVGRFLKISPYLGFATCLTALYGFPFDAIMTERICQEEGADKAEVDFLISPPLFPPMIVGGFVTVTITSVILAASSSSSSDGRPQTSFHSGAALPARTCA